MECATAAGASLATTDLSVRSPYARWLQGEGLGVFDASMPLDLHRVELSPWARRGGRGAFVHPAEQPLTADCYVCEIPPGQGLAPRRHLFEEIVLVLEGRGSTSFANDQGVSRSFEWTAGTLFSVPLNATYRHFNGSGRRRALMVAVTTAPAVLDAFADAAFVFDCRHDFGRMSDRSSAVHVDHAGLDAMDCPLMRAVREGAGGLLRSHVGTRTLWAAIAQLSPATYGKAQAYAATTYTVVLAGEGYVLAWTEGGERRRLECRAGTLFACPSGAWRQPFNTGRRPLRCVTLAAQAALSRRADGTPHVCISRALGGACIDYAEESADIRASFAVALTANGLESHMGAAYAADSRESGFAP